MIYIDLVSLVLVTAGLTGFTGIVVYLAFYLFLNKRYAGNLKSTSRLKEEVVMCGMEYDEEELSIPISKVFTDIMRRSLPKITYGIERGGGSRILNDWFTWMIILLTIIIIVSLLLGW